MTVKCNPYGLSVYEFIDVLVEWEIMGPEQGVDERHIRHLPGSVNLPAINCPHLDNPVRIAEGERQRRTVEINNHTGNGGIEISNNAVLETEHNAGIRITVIVEIVLIEQQKRADDCRDFSTAMRDSYQEREAFFHHY